jgi:outer membrane protein
MKQSIMIKIANRNNRILGILALFLLTATASFGQTPNFAYVDSEYILAQMPDYRSAQNKIDELADKWQKEIEKMHDAVDKMYKDYKAEELILTEDQKKSREAEIIAKQNEVKKYQNEKFGYEGELFSKRQELIKPIQDRVFNAVQKIAKQNRLDIVFDKSGSMTMLFSNATFDKSDEVLEELGITPLKDQDKGGDKNEDLPPSDTPPE